MRFTRALVRAPSRNYAHGLTSCGEGPPHLARALEQHEAYCAALRDRGLAVTHLETAGLPDDTFVEDAAVVTSRGAVITRPGAPSRRGEVDSVAAGLRQYYPALLEIEPPGTLDGGDVCEADEHFLVGISARTNEAGAEQLARHLRGMGYTATLIDIRAVPGLLHLKTGIAYLGEGAWLVASEILDTSQSWAGLRMRSVISADGEETYAANCLRIGDAVLVARGYPRVAEAIRGAGLRAVLLEMSEFRKMDGGLSCLSLRF
jgi:dimethylargininase